MEKSKSQILFECNLRRDIEDGLLTDFDLLLREEMIFRKLGGIPMNDIAKESTYQFDRLLKFGFKLNLITGIYSK